ncbi:hypothetical protein [Asanoa ishikariensis]|uniref:hypothetical protein n=1 Tax=Asanoa ishikariensis TaxID=137265 RepID=UPI000B87E07D|nr:hypothetical protein [Asanoa ishikariensis]
MLIEAPWPAALLVVTFVIHDVPAAVRLPYWLDEAWVAVSVRYPVTDLPEVTSSTPIGWTALLRLIPDPDALRLLPLAFLGVSVLGGYAVATVLRWPSTAHRVTAGLTTGLAVVLLPAQHLRHDLKQYTADAAVALLLLAMVGFAEATWSYHRLALLIGVSTFGVLVSHTAMLVGGCAVGGLVLTALVRKQWRAAAATSVAGLVIVMAFGAAYFGLAKQGSHIAMANYWNSFFPPLADLPGYLPERVRLLERIMGAPWQILLPFAAAGVVGAARLGRLSVAIGAAMLAPAAVAAGVARLYPLLDPRTSHFMLVTVIAFAALGVAYLATLLGRALNRTVPGAAFAAMLALTIVGGYAHQTSPWFRFDGDDKALGERIPAASEDVRTQVRYVWTHRRPSDIVLVGGAAAYGFAFYWPEKPGRRPDPELGTGWRPAYADTSIVLAAGRDAISIRSAIVTATENAKRSGPGAVVWVIRTHVNATEERKWKQETANLKLRLVVAGGDAVPRLEGW